MSDKINSGGIGEDILSAQDGAMLELNETLIKLTNMELTIQALVKDRNYWKDRALKAESEK